MSDVRAAITAVLVFMSDSDVEAFRTYVTGWGTIALMLADDGGRTLTMSHARIEKLAFLDEEFGYSRNAHGSRCGLVTLSCDSRWYRST
jgi:hypothetical protein